MPMDFPSSPTVGQQYNGYVWTGTAWDSTSAQPISLTTVASGDNAIINGAFDIWQRGTSFTNVASVTYTADRWWVGKDATATLNVSRQSLTPGIQSIFGFETEYNLRFDVSAWTSSPVYLTTRLEDVRTLAGQTVTLSYWAKSNVAVTSTPLYLQNFGSGGSTVVAANVSNSASITTSWQKFTHTFVLPSVSGKTIGTGSYLDMQVLRFSQAATVDIWGVQLEAGSAATAFRRNAPSIQAELAACRRYFQVYGNSPVGNFTIQAGTGPSFSTTQSVHVMQFDTPLRTTPSITTSGSTNFSVDLVGVTSASSTAMLFDHMNENMTRIVVTHNSNGSMGLHKAVVLIANNTANARIYVNAEL